MDPDEDRQANDAPPPDAARAPAVTLRPRWLWIIFALVTIAIPLLGLLLERNP
jgi:hypothetical protein